MKKLPIVAMLADRLTLRRGRRTVVLLQCLSLSACSHLLASPQAPNAAASGPPVSLAVNGFNYTDLPIDYFSVGGAGSDLVVSSTTSGGGKTSCCVVLLPGAALPTPVKVEWMRYVNGKQRWCETTAKLSGPVPERPTALGVHFMPSGEVLLEMSHGYPELKLRLESFDDSRRHERGNVIHDEETASCRDVR